MRGGDNERRGSRRGIKEEWRGDKNMTGEERRREGVETRRKTDQGGRGDETRRVGESRGGGGVQCQPHHDKLIKQYVI